MEAGLFGAHAGDAGEEGFCIGVLGIAQELAQCNPTLLQELQVLWATRPIKSGEFHPFTGPITKQDGTTVGEAGKALPDGDILGMMWYVKGVDDKLPQ